MIRSYINYIKNCLIFSNQLIRMFSIFTKAQKHEMHACIIKKKISKYTDLFDIKISVLL